VRNTQQELDSERRKFAAMLLVFLALLVSGAAVCARALIYEGSILAALGLVLIFAIIWLILARPVLKVFTARRKENVDDSFPR